MTSLLKYLKKLIPYTKLAIVYNMSEQDSVRQLEELRRLQRASEIGADLGLQVNAGHGLHYENVHPIVEIPQLVELNIGHAIVARALFVGMKEAVAEMRRAMRGG